MRRPGASRAKPATKPAAPAARGVRELREHQAELEIQNQALRYSQAAAEGATERFLTLFSNVPLALMLVDENSLVLESNAMALRLLRPLEQDPPLNFLLPFVSPAHTDRVSAAFQTALAMAACETTEVVFSCGSAGAMTGDLHIARIENSQDELAHFICAIVDQGPLLNERLALRDSAHALQQRNLELQSSQQRLAAIIDASLDAIIGVDHMRRITVFNPTAEALFSCPAADALGCDLSRFLPELITLLPSAPVSTKRQLGELTGRTASGSPVAIELSLSFEHRADGGTTTIFARDLSARKNMEAQRNTLEAQLRESHKMQAVGTMAGGIAHDFNNIIGAILGNTALAQQDVGPASPAQVSLSEIDKAGRRARDLVRQILAFSRNESPARVPLQLAEVVRETVRLLKVTLPPNVEMQVNLAPNTPAVLADATQVEQALLNLCTNAIQALGQQRGWVSIELSHQDPVVSGAANGAQGLSVPHARLAVHDTGPGMDPLTLERVFEPFFTTKPVGQGTGLGLAVVHGIMRTHEGSVEVRSQSGAGSSFTLCFPLAAGGAIPAVAARPVTLAVAGRGQRVMYVDDDQALVFLVDRALSRKGYVVSGFTDPLAALEALRERPLAFDLLVSDYNMPGFCGLELLREARQIWPSLPVALASGFVTADIEQSALAEGARALIHKPNDVEELCETVQRLLQGGGS